MSHVFTQTPDQLDVDVDPDDCRDASTTATAASWTARCSIEWIDRFWTASSWRRPIPRSPTAGRRARRRVALLAVPGFLGVYAASSPEEDLAESFSAYVFGLDVPDERAASRCAWVFAETFRARSCRALVAAAGADRPAGHFDDCAPLSETPAGAGVSVQSG